MDKYNSESAFKVVKIMSLHYFFFSFYIFFLFIFFIFCSGDRKKELTVATKVTTTLDGVKSTVIMQIKLFVMSQKETNVAF